MYSVPTPTFSSPACSAFATNSGPLSLRMWPGTPRIANSSHNASITSSLVMLRSIFSTRPAYAGRLGA
ncbi:hypothetical protein Pla108_14270 [Botrimarina colliarenosi]|uniref:Uncharacterized protein n=1 Tax=Botrimarina colliarenosi TaxID=2528001 RepID=A0A5C6AMW9_9BACT|nr:hypothetical protein Pla108_14270 [Botrimarina colliarenosi]